jgi:hypothetical protein
MKYGISYDFAEQEIVDCCIYALSGRICGGNDGCDGGNSDMALNYVAVSGIALETAYPYKSGVTEVNGTCKNASTARNKVVNNATPVTYITRNSSTALKTALNTKPIVVYVDAR